MIFDKSKDNFKFEYLKVYAWDRAMGGKRKFRRVFERNELNYVSAEFSIFNKLFDEKDWKAKIKLVANRISSKTEEKICEKEETVDIRKDQNIFKYNYGWGNDTRGKFWTKGTYEWKAFIDNELVGTTKFYVEDAGRVTVNQNPYFEVLSLNTYEAPEGDVEADKRVFLKSFKQETSRYVMGELRFSNNIPHEWYCEIFFNIFDDTGMHAGTATSFIKVTPHEGTGEEFTVTAGWGAPNPGTWITDKYTMEVVFMDTVVAIIPFSIGQKEIKRISEFEALLNEDVSNIYADIPKVENTTIKKDTTEESGVEILIDDRPVEEILAELNALIGLENIKAKIKEYIEYISFLQYREQAGIKESDEIVLHSVFTGNPGTGKTTVVKLLGKIFKSMGLLSKGHVHTVEANDLISGYIRQTGSETKKAIEKARGGILFIDEAYMLHREGFASDYGPEAVAALLTEMSDGKGDIAIMVAGYPNEMQSFINSNPGMKSRFRNYYHFDDYTPDELLQIAGYAAKKKGVSISKDAEKKLNKIITDAFRKRDKTFGNARFAHSLIDEAKINLGIRVMKNLQINQPSKELLSTLISEDIEDTSVPPIKKNLHIGIDEDLLKEAKAELQNLIGLQSIKEEVDELIKLTRYYRETQRDVLKAFSIHSVFLGNPGTGKTTVARILAKLYKALGILERGHLIDADGSDLEAGYLGQTAEKTKKIIQKAMGGILFIDEAYSMTEGRNNDFGKKAVAALIKEMEDHRGEFGVIVAGYTGNMEQFLKFNPGLTSRFDQKFYFQDFEEKELWEIAEIMFRNKGLEMNQEAQSHLKVYVSFLYKNRDKFFGNARSIRKIVEKTCRNQELRMADTPRNHRTEEMKKTVTLDDVKEFYPAREQQHQRTPIGFKLGS